MRRAPKDYWQDRAIQAEEAIVRLSCILHAHFPAMRGELEWHKAEWNRTINEVGEAYPESPEKILLDSPE